LVDGRPWLHGGHQGYCASVTGSMTFATGLNEPKMEVGGIYLDVTHIACFFGPKSSMQERSNDPRIRTPSS
jgi:hypothetical protein